MSQAIPGSEYSMLVTIHLDTTFRSAGVALKSTVNFIPSRTSIFIHVCSVRCTGHTMTITHILFGLTIGQGSFHIFKFPVFPSVQHLQVLNTIIEFVAVDVVDLLFPSKQAAYSIL